MFDYPVHDLYNFIESLWNRTSFFDNMMRSCLNQVDYMILSASWGTRACWLDQRESE